MANLRQAKKALRQSKKRAERNLKAKTELRDLGRHARIAITAKDATKAQDLVKQIIQKVDKAVKKNILKKNTAARRKSRLMKRLNAILPTTKKPAAKAKTKAAAPKKKA